MSSIWGTCHTAYYEAGFAIHELALKAKAIYESPKAKTEDKRLLLSYAFSNLSLNADKISPNYTLAFEFMAEWMPKLNRTFELEVSGLNKDKRGISASPCPTLLPIVNMFRRLEYRKFEESLVIMELNFV